MTSREIIARTIKFQNPRRLARDFPERYGSDFAWVEMSPSPDIRPTRGIDEWGCVWENIGAHYLGEVKDFPLKDWKDFNKLKIPDINDPARFKSLEGIRERARDKFLMGIGISIYERVHFIRGLENTWMDIYEYPDELGRLIDILVDMNMAAIKKYAEAGVDGLFITDDWGLQSQLMISPDSWRKIWKPRYARIFEAAHSAGIHTLMHSCGYIVDIMDDLIEIGLDAINMQQQENMGLELLGSRFGGRITFYCPVDIQSTMVYGTAEEIRAYCRKMVKLLGRPEGGFIPSSYDDPEGIGHKQENLNAMCEEFIKISMEMYGA